MIGHRWKHWLGLFLAWILFPSVVLAQQTGQTQEATKPPVAQYVVAILATLLIMVIICKPSRKG